MNCFGKSACLALALAGIVGAAAADEDQAQAGRQSFQPALPQLPWRYGAGGAFPIGPSLAGIIRAVEREPVPSGIHSRPAMDSGIVWDRASLRRFLSNPEREIPGTLMATSVTNRAQLESLLDMISHRLRRAAWTPGTSLIPRHLEEGELASRRSRLAAGNLAEASALVDASGGRPAR